MRDLMMIVEGIGVAALHEAKTIPIHAATRHGNYETVVTQNPWLPDLKRLLDASDRHALRGTVDGTDVYVWPAVDIIHLHTKDALGLNRACPDFWVVHEDAEPFSPDWADGPRGPVRDGMEFRLGRDAAATPGIRRLLQSTSNFGDTT